jgi:putative hemolysin
MEVLLIALLTVLNGVFAMSEMALASSRKARLLAMEEAGDHGAAAAVRLLEHPTQFLSTVQVGITATGILNGIVGEAAFSAGVARWLAGFGMTAGAASVVATGLVVAAITFITIISASSCPSASGSSTPRSSPAGPRARWRGSRARRGRS